jgi:hypothetical protein
MRGNKCSTLDLSGNDVPIEGARAIGAQLASSHCTLTSINLDGFALPVKKLRGGVTTDDTKPPDTISLQKKRLGPLSGIVIGALVRHNSSLAQLNLSGNALGVAGITALAEATAANTALQQVDVRNNKLDDKGKAAVRSVAPLQVSGRLLVSTPDSDAGRGAEAEGAAKVTKALKVGGEGARPKVAPVKAPSRAKSTRRV